jgi:hypothetical protein
MCQHQSRWEKSYYDASSLRFCPTCRYHPMSRRCNSNIVQAVEEELAYANDQSSDDPVHNAQVAAAAHSLLANKESESFQGLESTTARAVHYSTMYSIAKWCRNVRLGDASSSNSTMLHRFYNQHALQPQSQQTIQHEAIRAFQCSSTYNRQINTTQYNSLGLHFLTDALFFNIHPSYAKDRTSSASWRTKLGCSTSNSKYGPHLEELLQDLNREQAHVASPHSVSELGCKFETSHHSWHVVRLTNPDYRRPITFRAYIQCPEDFTVFPSQGYLRGGETVYLVLGVRMHGSLLNEALEAVDVERDEVCC